MKVNLLKRWFLRTAPNEPDDARSFRGILFRAGEHDISENAYQQLSRGEDGTLAAWVEIIEASD